MLTRQEKSEEWKIMGRNVRYFISDMENTIGAKS
jgi:hypothetical protein